jgi:DNA polymerase II small subunit/DNA polymerase delta subunit B
MEHKMTDKSFATKAAQMTDAQAATLAKQAEQAAQAKQAELAEQEAAQAEQEAAQAAQAEQEAAQAAQDEQAATQAAQDEQDTTQAAQDEQDTTEAAQDEQEAQPEPVQKRKAKKWAAPQLDAQQLRDLLELVEVGNTIWLRAELIDRLAKLHKAKIERAEGRTHIDMAGVKASAASDEVALTVWCNAARRACLSRKAV